MRGHITRRGKSYALVLDMGTQSARRCPANHRAWARDTKGDACPRCGAALGEARRERRQRWETHRLRRDAEAALSRYLADVDRGGDPFPRDATVREYLEEWLDRRAARIRPRTLHRYRELVSRNLLPALGDLRLDRVRRDDVQRALDAMATEGLAPRTIGQARAIINRAYVEALEGDLVQRNPVSGTRAPKASDPGLAVLRPEHLTAIIDAAEGTTWAIPLLLAASTGARRSEILALRWSDLDLDRASVTIVRSLQLRPKVDGGGVEFHDPKTARSRRTLRLPEMAVRRLRQHRREQGERRLQVGPGWSDLDLVCEDGIGGPLHPDAFTSAFKRTARKAGLPPRARLHDLRHGVAVLLALEGVPLEAVSALLGHASAGFTLSVYRHAIDEMTQGAADALDRRLGGSR